MTKAKISGVLADVRTEHMPNTSPEIYMNPLGDLSGEKSLQEEKRKADDVMSLGHLQTMLRKYITFWESLLKFTTRWTKQGMHKYTRAYESDPHKDRGNCQRTIQNTG